VDAEARQGARQGRRAIDLYLNIILLVFVAATGIAAVWLRNLLASAMVLGIYSLLMASLWVVLDAVDVAFTEAAVGAGVTTVLMLLAIALTGRREKRARSRPWAPLAVSLATAGLLVYATLGMPAFGSADAPAQLHVAPYYLRHGEAETGVPNVVTSVLASYRGFDTLGEVTVIFTAGIGVLVLLGSASRRRRNSATPAKGDSA
jgi:multicomponent Na+:H+ antiporter subunit B|tara:strand:- start:27 stop:638 length:612 start_codon:yes stop_codon:yes gene_type:complete